MATSSTAIRWPALALPVAAPAPPPVVLYTLGKLDVGGAEMRSLQYFTAIRKRHPGLSITVYVTSSEPGELNESFLRIGVRIVQGRSGLRAMPHFWRTCLRERPTLLHSNVGTTSGFFALAGFLAGVRRRICHYRSTEEYRPGFYGRFKLLVGVTLIRLFATRIVGVCDGARSYARVSERRWLTLYNGIPAEEWQAETRAPDDDDAPTVLVLGRIAPEKNCPRAVSIFERLAEMDDSPGPQLHFVGTGKADCMARLDARITASPAAAAIRTLGLSREPLRHLRGADVLLLPSLQEGLPGSVLEALSVGTPVVASDLPGTREIAAEVEGVTLVPLDSGDEAWAEAIRAALARADRREAIVRSFARSPFRFDSYVARMAELWGLAA